MKDINFIQILWEYMKMNHELKHSDCIIGLGSMNINVANVTSELYLKGYANKIIFSGGLGKITYKLPIRHPVFLHSVSQLTVNCSA